MRWFRTRHEVRQLRSEVRELRAMLVAHFGIRYTLQDFKDYAKRHPDNKVIPVTYGEWHHYSEMLQPAGKADVDHPANTDLSYRNKQVLPMKKYTEIE